MKRKRIRMLKESAFDAASSTVLRASSWARTSQGSGLRSRAITALAERVVAYWSVHRPSRQSLLDGLHELNGQSEMIAVLDFRGRSVSVRSKPTPDPSSTGLRATSLRRANQYARFLSDVASMHRLNLNLSLAINVFDTNLFGVNEYDLPVFAFQKAPGSTAILLPDVDFFNWIWYVLSIDTTPYMRKDPAAVFVGSSSGGLVTREAILTGKLPRLRAAASFVGSDTVDFRLANAVQCDGPETEGLLKSQAYFSKPTSWREQLQSRFIISMDGNGATCSRVAIALKSNSALLKYNSDNELYYFDALVPGRHFLPIDHESEINDAVLLERAQPGRFREVADEGRAFFSDFLAPARVAEYTATVIQTYDGILSGSWI